MSAATSKADGESLRQTLFESVEASESSKSLVDLFLHHSPCCFGESARDQRGALLHVVASLTKASARRFFDGVRNRLKGIVENELFVPESAYVDEDDDEKHLDTDHGAILSDAQSALALEFLKVVVLCMEKYVQSMVEKTGETKNKTIAVVEEAYHVMEMLHNCLISLQASGDEGLGVQNKISALCEYWWNHNFVDRECMVVQLLPLLVAKSLDETATKADISRLFAIRHALDVLDFDNQSSTDIKSLLTRTVSSPLYIKSIEGRKLISYLFDYIPADIHQAIRVQILDAKKTTLDAYGEIYFRAWKESEDASNFEETVLQELCYAIIHIGNPTMAKSLHIVLDPFHRGQASPPVKQLLHRVYGPILWRSLRAANPRVRVNAASVLGAVFPLADGVNVDKAMQKAILALKHLLQDTDPRVRVAGSAATAAVLVTLWDALPPCDIRALLNHIIAEHASDVSSSAVRVGAVHAVSVILDAEQAHAVLRALLPSLGNLIHDKVERVRLATVRLLAKIKAIHGIKYYHVVPVHHLLARLVEEGRPPKNICNPVASALTNLMMNSYFPQNVPTVDQVNRTVKFLSSDPRAAAIFYANLSSHLAVNSVAKLAAMLLRCLIVAVQNDQSGKENRKRRRYGTHQDDDDDAANEGDESISAKNTSLMASAAETICCLWESIETNLQDSENKPSSDFLVNAFSGAVLANVHSHFEEMASGCDQTNSKELRIIEDCHRVCSAILRCAGRLEPESVKGLAHQITSKLGAIEDEDGFAHENITPHVALLCLWGMTEDVAHSLASSIVKSFSHVDFGFDKETIGKKRKSGRSGKVSEDSVKHNAPFRVPQLPSHVAIEVLESILRGSDPSSAAARNAILLSSAACSAIEKALEKGTIYVEHLLLSDPVYAEPINASDVELVLRACETYGRFALHKEAFQNETVTLSAEAKTLLNWTTNRVVPVLIGQSGRVSSNPFLDLNLSRISSVPDTPRSPEAIPSHQKRTDRKRTPNKLDSSFEVDTMVLDCSLVHTPPVLARGAAISLLQSSCVIFSEWLVVGGSGVKEIAQAAIEWCAVFSVENNTLQTELLPAFLRLAVQVCRLDDNFSLLGRLLVKCDETDDADEEALIKKTVTALLTGRDHLGNSMQDGVLKELLISARSIIAERGHAADSGFDDVPSNWKEVWGFKRGYIIPVLAAITSNKKACAAFAETVVAALLKGQDENETDEMILFQLRCLWFMCETSSDNHAIQKAIRRLMDTSQFDRKGVQDIVDRLISFYA